MTAGWDCGLLDACLDKEGFAAILALHQQLDDDANGNVDIAESDEPATPRHIIDCIDSSIDELYSAFAGPKPG
ncbi:STIM2 [Cordylochernes scorpioides]|uniref:STIM2 n=1 Tax=Cordylochernes scorpioides TaxID=51811 RepID=A0ABY6L6B7_9ARAC|nr:STIM2 [Cordylochernes scorpioides]